MLEQAGFDGIELVPTRVYSLEDARGFLESNQVDLTMPEEVDGAFMSAFIRARKP